MKTKVFPFLLFVLIAICFVSPVLCTRPHYVYDNADLLTGGEEAVIHDLCYQHDLNSTNEVVVYTMLNLDTYGGDMDLARNKIFNEVALDGVKGIGKADKDNGVLLVVAKTDSRWGIEVGYGVEGDLTDGECARIGRALKPELQEGNYTAIITAVSSLIEELSGESNSFNIDDTTTWILVAVVIVVIIGVVVFFASKGNGSSGGYSGGYSGGGGFGGGGSGGGGASGICETTQSLPTAKRKKILKYKVCPTCNTKRRCELNREYKDETTKGLWIYVILVTAVTCLTCNTSFSTNKTLRQIETVNQRKTRRAKEAVERERRRKQQATEDEERRRRRRREDSYRSSSYSSGGFSSGGFGGGGFGGGSSGGGGASG